MHARRLLQRWFYRRQSAGLIAGACLLLVTLTAYSIYQLSWRSNELALAGYSRDLITLLSQRMRAHEQILRGGAGLFEASDEVTRSDWHAYVSQLRLPEKYPGIQGVGFAQIVTLAQRDLHTAAVRAEGFPTYRITPSGDREKYLSIVYLEPFSGRNLAAFGYDMLSEPVRADAVMTAIRTGTTSISGRVRLLQETQADVQPGFLMYVPVYQRGLPTSSEAERLQAIRGVVYSPFRTHDLIHALLKDYRLDIEFALFDGADIDDESALVFSSVTQTSRAWQESNHRGRHVLDEFGRNWTLTTWLPPHKNEHAQTLIVAVSALGSIISVLLFFLFNTLARREEQAARIANQMTDNYRLSEAALAASAQRARAIIDNVADAILTLRAEGTILQHNRAAERLFGYGDGTLTGINIQRLMPAVPAEQLQALLRDASHAATMSTPPGSASSAATAPLRELEARRADQSSVPVEMTLSAIPNAEPETFVAVCRDISERRRVDRLKREFVSTVSHELRTPLTALSGSLALLVSEQFAHLPQPVHDVLMIAHRNSRRLSELINDLLDMEQISRGQMTFFVEPLSVNMVLEQALAAIESYGKSVDVSLQRHNTIGDLQIQADRKRLQQVLIHLLSNAIKFSPKAGTVTLTGELRGHHVRIAISDQGPGVPKDFEAHLFQSFSRADSDDNRRIGGTGLGLVISKELTERMHGRIGYHPLLPHGACFYVEFPLFGAT